MNAERKEFLNGRNQQPACSRQVRRIKPIWTVEYSIDRNGFRYSRLINRTPYGHRDDSLVYADIEGKRGYKFPRFFDLDLYILLISISIDERRYCSRHDNCYVNQQRAKNVPRVPLERIEYVLRIIVDNSIDGEYRVTTKSKSMSILNIVNSRFENFDRNSKLARDIIIYKKL